MSELANRSFFKLIAYFANFFAKNELFAQKTDEQIASPDNLALFRTFE